LHLHVPGSSIVFVLMTLKLYTISPLRRGLMIHFVIALCPLIIILFFV